MMRTDRSGYPGCNARKPTDNPGYPGWWPRWKEIPTLERVFDQLDRAHLAGAINHQRDHRKAHLAPPSRQGPVLGRGGAQCPPLARPHRLGRRPKGLAGARLDLDQHQAVAEPANQGDLAAAGPKAGADDLPAPPL